MKTSGAALFALLSFAAGMLIGYSLSHGRKESRRTEANLIAATSISDSAALSSANQPEDSLKNAEVSAWMSALGKIDSVAEGTAARTAAVSRFLDLITPSNWQEVHDHILKAARESMLTDEEQSWCLERIGAVGRAEALRWFEAKNPNFNSSGGWLAIRGWAAEDPAAAASFIESLPSNRAHALRIQFVYATAATHPDEARKILSKLPVPFQAVVILDNLAGKRKAEGFIRDWLIANGINPELREKGDGSVAQIFLKMAAGRGLVPEGDMPFRDWLDQFKTQPFAQADHLWWLSERLHQNPKSDAAKDLDWLTTFSAAQPQTARRTFEKFFAEAPAPRMDSALQWLSSNPDHVARDDAVLGLICNPVARASLGVSELQAWAETIKDEGLRGRATAKLASSP
jgi:hypothetical protein